MARSDVELLRAAWEAFARGDVEAATEALDPHVRWYAAGDLDGEGACRNREDAAAFLRRAMADGVTADLLDLRDAGDRLVAIIHTHAPPEWERSPDPHGEIVTIRDGKVTEMVIYATVEDALAAAGLGDPPTGIASTSRGAEDVVRAATALASRLPWPLGVLARLAYNYRWSWLAGRAGRCSATSTPTAGTRATRNPVRLLQEASAEALLRAAADDGARRARRGARARHRSPTWPAPRRRGWPPTAAPIAFFCAEYGDARIAADLLRRPRRARRRHPQGGLRPRAAARRRRPAVPPGLLPPAHRRDRLAARVLGRRPTPSACRPRSSRATTASRSRSRCRSAATTSSRRSGGSTSGACRCSCSTPTGPRTTRVARWITSRLYVGDPEMRLAQYVLLGVGGMAALEALGIDPEVVHLNEGHAAFAGARARAPRSSQRASTAPRGARGRRAAARSSRRTRRCPPATTPTRPTRSATRCAPICAAARHRPAGARPRAGARTPTTTHEPFGVTQFALRTQPRRQRREPPPRRGRARDVAATCGPTARSTTSRSRTSPTASTCPPGSAGRCAGCSTATSARAGSHRAARPGDVGRRRQRSRTRSCGPCAASSAPGSSTTCASAAVVDRLGRGDPRELRRGRRRRVRPRRPHDRLRPPPGDLQAPAPAAPRRRAQLGAARPATGRSSSLIAGKAHPRDDEGKRLVQAPVRRARTTRAPATRVVFLDDYDLAIAARLVQGCDVWVNVPRPPLEASGTSGMKSARQRRPAAQRARRLVGRGLRRHQRLGAVRRGRRTTTARRTPRDAAELYRLLEEEVVPAVLRARRRRPAARWLAAMRASLRTLRARSSRPRAWCATTRSALYRGG